MSAGEASRWLGLARTSILDAMARSPVVAALYRAPLRLHRLGIRGLERLIGIDWIVLTMRGRRSGVPREVMLDVIGHDDATDTWYVQPADGRRANWFQNLLATPTATVEVRGRRFEATAIDVTGPEGAEVILRFIRTHPLYARLIVWFIPYVDSIDHPDETLRAKLKTVPVMALRPNSSEDSRSR
jgi:deazaflavin-dependent oxidoreductase (nitroreductase family)